MKCVSKKALAEFAKIDSFAAVAQKYNMLYSYNEELFPVQPFVECVIGFWRGDGIDHAQELESAKQDCYAAAAKAKGKYTVEQDSACITITRVG